jgi:hypothetical protein
LRSGSRVYRMISTRKSLDQGQPAELQSKDVGSTKEETAGAAWWESKIAVLLWVWFRSISIYDANFARMKGFLSTIAPHILEEATPSGSCSQASESRSSAETPQTRPQRRW